MVVEVAKDEFLPGVAKVHRKCFPEYFITTFGESLIEEYYRCYLKIDNLFVVAKEGETIIGFCMGYRQGSNARSTFLKENKIKLSLKMILQIFRRNKLVITKCWNYFLGYFVRKKSETKCSKIVDGDLLSICVLPEFRGKGISVELVKEFEKLLTEQNIGEYLLSVYKTNIKAIHFYTKMGFTVIAETDDEYKMFKRIEVENDNN